MAFIDPDYEAQMIEMQDEFVWETPEFERYERGARWYIITTFITILLVFYAIWTANYLFAFIVLLSAIILILAGNEHPNAMLVQIGHNGIVYHDEFIPYESMYNFSIIYKPPLAKVLYIEPRGARPRIRIELGEQDPVAIREHLKLYVAEDLGLQDEHATDILAKLFKI